MMGHVALLQQITVNIVDIHVNIYYYGCPSFTEWMIVIPLIVGTICMVLALSYTLGSRANSRCALKIAKSVFARLALLTAYHLPHFLILTVPSQLVSLLLEVF